MVRHRALSLRSNFTRRHGRILCCARLQCCVISSTLWWHDEPHHVLLVSACLELRGPPLPCSGGGPTRVRFAPCAYPLRRSREFLGLSSRCSCWPSVAGQISTYYLRAPRLSTRARRPLRSRQRSQYAVLVFRFSPLDLFRVLALIATAKTQSRDRYRWHWVGLSAGFLYCQRTRRPAFTKSSVLSSPVSATG